MVAVASWFVMPIFAEDGPGMTSMPNNINGQSSAQFNGNTPNNPNQQSQNNLNSLGGSNSSNSSDGQKYNECIANYPGETEYCSCIAEGGIKLNTNVPFVGKCINKDNSSSAGSSASTAFTDLIGGLSKIVVTVILIVSLMFVIIGGVQRASGNPWEGKKKIIKVAIGLAILGASGAILRLINPNFFT